MKHKKHRPLTIRVVKPEEEERFNRLLDEQHPQRRPPKLGSELPLVIEENGMWVGLMLWRSACQRLEPRDLWIGWTAAQRAQRLKLVVQLTRYLLLSEKGTRPNWASEALAAATRSLAELWKAQFGYEPLLAETFSDPTTQAGTCYKAAGWKGIGETKGYAKHSRHDYAFHGQPKRLWLRPLRKKAVEWLRAPHLSRRYEAGATAAAHGQMPLKPLQMHSLAEVLRRVPDPRAKNRVYPLGTLLAVIAMALLSGARDIAQIQRFGWRLLPAQRAALGFRRKPGQKVFLMPSYSVYWSVLVALDLEAFAQVLSDWLRAQQGSLPKALALDGKMIRQTIGVLSLVEVETGVPVAMQVITQKKGDGEHGEKRTARRLLDDQPDGEGGLMTGDALHTDRTMATLAVENGYDYLLQVKGNQPTLQAHIAQKNASTPFLT